MESIPEAPAVRTEARALLPWYLRPYLHLWLSIVFSASSQPLMKQGADQVRVVMTHAGAPEWQGPFYFLANGWIWLAIGAIITSLLSWMYALKTVPLTIAFNLAAIIHVLVPLASWLFLGEQISLTRWAGITLVFLGVLIIAREAGRLEEKL
jgi:drug/metabolite transporter (DMT)-like permease